MSITVSAFDANEKMLFTASFANYGKAVDFLHASKHANSVVILWFNDSVQNQTIVYVKRNGFWFITQ